MLTRSMFFWKSPVSMFFWFFREFSGKQRRLIFVSRSV